MRVELCAIAKNEHLYIDEWVAHYLKLGFDKITIFDNDDEDKPYIGDFINKELLKKIEIINVRGIHKHAFQHECYNKFYKQAKCDWVMFCDIDEFLVGVDNIKTFLSQKKFNNFGQIRIKWCLFGDDNKISRDINKPVFGSFRNVITNNKLSNQSKAIIRGRLNIEIHSCHFVESLMSCYPNGQKCQSKTIELNDYYNQTVYLFHYMTKTLIEFISQKLNRGDAIFEDRQIKLDYYWRINKKTPEKIEYLKNIGIIK